MQDDRDRRSGRRGARRGRPSGPEDRPTNKLAGTPGGAREPIGRDRAERRRDAPPRPARGESAPARPELPVGEEPQLPRSVRKEIDRVVGAPRADDVALALSIGSAAIDDERPDVAREMLSWAKHQAPRISAIREAYGVALYLDGEFAKALTELQAYRRMTSRHDQNHLVADCMRALGRDVDQIVAVAASLVEDASAPQPRRAEAAIVWASVLAEHGDVAAGRAVIRRRLERPRSRDEEHDLRLRYVAAELAGRDGATDEVIRQLELIVAADPNFLDAAELLGRARAGD